MGLVAVCEISMMICEIASVNDMLRNDDATSIASYHRYSPFRVLPFWSSLFLLSRAAVLDVDVRIMTSSVMAQ